MKPMSAREIFWNAKFIQWMGLELKTLEGGVCESSLLVREEFKQQDGYVHAGIITTLADHSAGGAAGTLLSDVEGVLSIEFKMNFLRPAKSDVLFCVAKILKKGRSIAVVESSVYSAVKKEPEDLVAKGTFTLAVMTLTKSSG